jgi:diguanylate cyclase (GGDEF)-like protein
MPTMPLSHTQRRFTPWFMSRVEPRQQQRIRRYGLACLIPLGYFLGLLVFFFLNLITRIAVLATAASLILSCALFLGLFLCNFNLKLQEKNMIFPMSVVMIGIMLVVCYFYPLTQVIYGPFGLLMMISAAFRIRQNTLFQIAGLILGGDILVLLALFLQPQAQPVMLVYMVLTNASILALTLPGFVYLGGKVRRLYRSLYMVSAKIETIEESARRDELTGSFNRRYLMASLQQQKHVVDASDQSLCLAVMDLDHFKRINDEVGHLAGDEVLRQFAKLAQQNIRREDVFGRYGGEEFLLMLPGVGLLEALNTIERIRALTETKLNILAKLDRKVTVSIGLTQFIPGETVLDLFARADVAMYMAKTGGRNQVVVQEPVEAQD